MTCSSIVQLALDRTGELCDTTGRNQACYGHILIDAVLQRDAPPLTFDEPGDLAGVLELQSLRLSAMNIEEGVWGVALLNIQAHRVYSQPEDVRFLLFGDVDIDNKVQTPTLLEVRITGKFPQIDFRQRSGAVEGRSATPARHGPWRSAR